MASILFPIPEINLYLTPNVTLFFSRAYYNYKSTMSSETTTPASITTSTTGNETLTLADEVKKYDTEGLISFLRSRDLGLDEDDEKILLK